MNQVESNSLALFFSTERGIFQSPKVLFCFIYLFVYLFIYLFRAGPTAYGSSQARGQIRAAVVGLYHSHGNLGSEPRLPPIPQPMATPQILNPLSETRD